MFLNINVVLNYQSLILQTSTKKTYVKNKLLFDKGFSFYNSSIATKKKIYITRYFRKSLKWNVTLNNTNIDINKFHKLAILIKKVVPKRKKQNNL